MADKPKSAWDHLIDPSTIDKPAETPGVVMISPWDHLIEETEEEKKAKELSERMPPRLQKKIDNDTTGLATLLGKATKYPRADAVLMEAAKGVPVAGAFVPQTNEMDFMERHYPGATAATNIAGGMAASAHPLGMLSRGTQLMKLPQQMAIHGAAGGVVGAADKKVRDPNASWSDVGIEGAKGAGFTSLGPLLSKILSPGMSDAQIGEKILKSPVSPYFTEMKDEFKALVRKGHTRAEAFKLAKEKTIDAYKGAGLHQTEGGIRRFLNEAADRDTFSAAVGRGAAATLPFILGGAHPYLSTAAGIGAAALPHISRNLPASASRLLNNSVFQNPDTSTILKILLEGANRGTSDPALGNLQVP